MDIRLLKNNSVLKIMNYIEMHCKSEFEAFFVEVFLTIELLNNKLHGLSPPGGLVSHSGGFASLLFDQGVPYYSYYHLADLHFALIRLCLALLFIISIAVAQLHFLTFSQSWRC
jgi:hypothetical protein